MTSTRTFDALVELTRTIRPQWDGPGIRAAIRSALAREPQPTIAELSYALIRCAENPTYGTPAIVALNGAHWGKSTKDPEEPVRAKHCAVCGEFHKPNDCPGPHIVRKPPAEQLRELRTLLGDAKRPIDRTKTEGTA